MFNVPSFWSLSKFLKFNVWLTDKILKMLQWNKEKQANHHVWQFVTSKWFVFLAGERLTDKYYHSIKKSAQIVLWTNWVSFIWLTIWRLIFPHKHSYLKENRFLDKLSPRVLGFSDFLSTGQKRRKIYFQKISWRVIFFLVWFKCFSLLKLDGGICCITDCHRYKTPPHPWSVCLDFCLILGNAFNWKAAEVATEITTVVRSQDTSDSLVTPFCTALIHNQPLFHRFPSLCPCSAWGLFQVSPALMLCLVRPQSPKGESVLNKLLIKHLSFSWGWSGEEGAEALRGDWDGVPQVVCKTGN